MASISLLILHLIACKALAIVLPTSAAIQSSAAQDLAAAVITNSPISQDELRKRQAFAPDVCGYSGLATGHCADTSETLMPNGHLYEYCATRGAFIHEVWTTVYAYGEGPDSCSPYELCW